MFDISENTRGYNQLHPNDGNQFDVEDNCRSNKDAQFIYKLKSANKYA